MYKMLNTNVFATYWESDCSEEHNVLGGVTQIPIRYNFSINVIFCSLFHYNINGVSQVGRVVVGG